ncbi:MAG: MATE family efflux transporter [bacterium]
MNFKENIKATFRLAIPVSIGQLGHVMLGVIDSVMVGKIGSVPLAASSLVNGLFFLVLVIGIGMSYAITPLVAISKSSGSSKECGLVLRHALIVNSILSLIIFGLIFGLSYLLKYMNQPPEVVDQAESYFRILSISVFPFMIFQSYRQFLEGLSYVNPPMVIAILANFLNAFLNWIFIYGKFGIPALGLDGAGIATTISRTVMALTLMIYVLRSKDFMEYEPLFKLKPIRLDIIKKIINIGLPSGMQYFFEVGAFAFAAVMMGWLGRVSLAAHQIAINLASVTYMIILGLSAAGTIQVGNALGKKSQREIRRAGFSALLLAGSIELCFSIAFIIFRNQLPLFYVNEKEVIEIASGLLFIAAFFQISDGLQAVSLGVLRGITDVKIPMLLTLTAYWVIGIPLCYLFGFILKYGATGIWFGLLLALTFVAGSLTMRFNKRSKTLPL